MFARGDNSPAQEKGRLSTENSGHVRKSTLPVRYFEALAIVPGAAPESIADGFPSEPARDKAS
jgi:hypothetical protein